MPITKRFVAKQGLDNNGKTITNLLAPINATDAANKLYVDSVFGNKEPAISVGSFNQYYRGDKTWQVLDNVAVGLSNVVNVDSTNANNITSGLISPARLGTGPASTNTYLRGDGTWQQLSVASGGSGGSVSSVNSMTGDVIITKSSIGLSNVQNVDSTNASNLMSGIVPASRLGTGTANNITFLRGDGTWSTLTLLNPVTSVNGAIGDVVIDKTAIGLSNVPNIDCTNADNITSGTLPINRIGIGNRTSTKFLCADNNWKELPVTSVNGNTGNINITKTDIGLGNVDNISLVAWTGSSNLVTAGNLNVQSLLLPHGSIYSSTIISPDTSSNQVLDIVASSIGKTLKYFIQVSASNGDFQFSEVAICYDIINESVMFNNISLVTFSNDVLNSNIRLLFTPISANTTIKFIRILISP